VDNACKVSVITHVNIYYSGSYTYLFVFELEEETFVIHACICMNFQTKSHY